MQLQTFFTKALAPKVVDQDPNITDSEEDKSAYGSKSPPAADSQSTNTNIGDDAQQPQLLPNTAAENWYVLTFYVVHFLTAISKKKKKLYQIIKQV